jgi:hypothetical protein
MGICFHKDFYNKYVVYLNVVMYKTIPGEKTGSFAGLEYLRVGSVRSC